MNSFFAVIGIAALAALIFYIKKGSDAKKEPSTETNLTQVHGVHEEQVGNETRKDAKLIVDTIKDVLKNALMNLQETVGFSEMLSYEEAMKYFIVHKDDSPEIVKGALLKEAIGDGFVITQVFLDKNNGVVMGCKRKVKRLDNELVNQFKDNDLIIVE